MNVFVRTPDIFEDVARSPEMRLWIGVLRVMVQDALGKALAVKATERDAVTAAARVWLCFGPDLHDVGMYAGFDGDDVRAWAIRQRENDWPDAARHPAEIMANSCLSAVT